MTTALPPSLLDSADLATVRRRAAALEGPYGTVFACLLSGGVVQHDPADPLWSDRDRIVVTDPQGARIGARACRDLGYPEGRGLIRAVGGEGLALAYGMAATSRIEGGIYRVWCVLDAGAVQDGEVWEAAVAAASSHAELLSVVLMASPADARPAAAVFTVAGWRVHEASVTEPLELLAALDHVLRSGEGPGAVVAMSPPAAG